MGRLKKRFLKCKSGATAIEYGLIAGFIGLSIIIVATQIGTELIGIFTDVIAGFQ